MAHRALLYSSEDEFLEQAVPFLSEGIAANEFLVAITTSGNAAALRAALGESADRVEFGESNGWSAHPARTHSHLLHLLAGGSGGGVRVLGERLMGDRTPAVARELARYEAVFNLTAPLSEALVMCPYDTRTIEAGTVQTLLRVHPEVIDRAELRASESYLDPGEFLREGDLGLTFEEPAITLGELRAVGGVSDVRRFVGQVAESSGLFGEPLTDFLVGVSEVATNALIHGGQVKSVRVWVDSGELVCEVLDEGTGLLDGLAGYLPPEHARAQGWGLWLARQLCDLLEISTGDRGTTVRLHAALPEGDFEARSGFGPAGR